MVNEVPPFVTREPVLWIAHIEHFHSALVLIVLVRVLNQFSGG